MKVLHIVPDSIYDPRQFFLGSTKDVRGRTEYFQARNIHYVELLAYTRSDRMLLRELDHIDVSQFTTILIELPIYPNSIRFLREKFSQIPLFTRSINAEFLHRLHYALAYISNRDTYRDFLRAVRTFLYSFVRLRTDYLCAKRSDYLLSITLWEKENYWKYLTDLPKVINVPYFLPRFYDQYILPVSKKKKQCVCLMSSNFNPFLFDAGRNFSNLVEKLGNSCPDWDFHITGEIPSNSLSIAKRIKRTGFMEYPFSILAESYAIALLSDFGFGFKTKIIDAILHGCYILVHNKLFQRLPLEVKPFCKVVEPNSVDSLIFSLEECLLPYPERNPNDEFRVQAYTVMDTLFGVQS